MGIVLELYELKNLCKDMAELGAANYAKMVFPALIIMDVLLQVGYYMVLNHSVRLV